MWHCKRTGCTYDSCEACYLRRMPGVMPWSKADTPEEKAKRVAAASLRRKIKERARDHQRDRSHRARPSREEERERIAALRKSAAESLTAHVDRSAAPIALDSTCRERDAPAPCIAAVQTTAEPTPSHPEPIVTPIPVALWEGMD